MSVGHCSNGTKGPKMALRGPAMMASAARLCASVIASRAGTGRRSAVLGAKPCGVEDDAGVGVDAGPLISRILLSDVVCENCQSATPLIARPNAANCRAP